MERFVDITDWPKTAKAKITRGKFLNDTNKHLIFDVVRVTNRRKGRFEYDLFLGDDLYLAGVNPLFLDFEAGER
ncbi:MAG: hypothetical protein ACOC31_01495 [Bacteroidota bacterium]